jgi:hypothetical protein
MFRKRHAATNPLGVELGDLLELLEPTSVKASLEGNTLTARHERYTVRVEVLPPDKAGSTVPGIRIDPIRAVVRVVTDVPPEVAEVFRAPEAIATANAFAALSALCSTADKVYIGSRLTIFENEQAWQSLHLPLLLSTVICGTDAIFGALRRTYSDESPREDSSDWTEGDIEVTESYLSRLCVCTTGGLGLTAEFGLSESAASAATGDNDTALLQLAADQPHPELGCGLLCSLQMPHQISGDARLREVCAQLNDMEMAAHALPPHFGAWCVGNLGNNPAYVSFLPNALHSVSGIATNAAFWAMHRARWANAVLASLGVGA